MRTNQGTQGHHGKACSQDEPRVGKDDRGCYQPHDGKLGHGNPSESVAGFDGAIAMDVAEKTRNENDASQVNELEDENRHRKDDEVPGFHEREIYKRVRLQISPDARG